MMTEAKYVGPTGVTAHRVAGWDSRCELLLKDELRLKLDSRAEVLELLSKKSRDCFLLEAPDGKPLLFIGFIPFTLLGGEAYIWMIPFPALGVRYIREARAMFMRYAKQYTKLTVQIMRTETTECRFLRFFGFEERYTIQHGLVVYERKR